MQNEVSLRVLYLYKLLLRYSDVEHPLSTNQILQLFDSVYGIQMHRTSVSKYVEQLCNSGVEVVEIRSRSKKYYINDRTFDLPELKLLIDAVQASHFISAKKSKALVEKLTSLASEKSKEDLKRNLINTSKVKSENEKTYYIIDAINEAINSGKKISFYYTEYDAQKKIIIKNNGEPYCISPYSLIWNGDYYYVVGMYESRKRIHTFRVDRIARRPEILSEDSCPAPAGFDTSEYALEVFQMFDTQKPVNVSLKCKNRLMKYVVDQFVIDVETHIIDEEYFRTRVTVCTSPNFYRWIFGWAGNVIIEEPQSVVDEYQLMLKAAQEAQHDIAKGK